MEPSGVIDLQIVPDPEDDEGAHIFVDGHVAGRPYRFLLDTGSAKTCLQTDAYTSSLPSAASYRSSGIFATSTSADLITVPSISLGPIRKTEFPVVRVPGAHTGPANLIGMDLLGDCRCHVRFDEDRILVNPAGEPAFETGPHALMFNRAGHPYVQVQVDGAYAQSVWDSGASLTIVGLAFVRRYPAAFEEAGFSPGTDATGAIQEGPTFVMSRIAVGEMILPPHTVAGVDLSPVNATIEMPMDLILGYSTMRHANWWFDFPGRRWAITKLLA